MAKQFGFEKILVDGRTIHGLKCLARAFAVPWIERAINSFPVPDSPRIIRSGPRCAAERAAAAAKVEQFPVLSLTRLTLPVRVRLLPILMLPTAPVPLSASVLVVPAAALTRVLKKTVPVPLPETAPPARLIEPEPRAVLPRLPVLMVRR